MGLRGPPGGFYCHDTMAWVAGRGDRGVGGSDTPARVVWPENGSRNVAGFDVHAQSTPAAAINVATGEMVDAPFGLYRAASTAGMSVR
jgi:hypothetical protein